MKTLVIVSHPQFEQSHVVRALMQTALKHPGAQVRHLEALFGNDPSKIDVIQEQRAHDGVDRVVYLYPMHWFNLTPMLKAYLNQVWTYGWAFGPDGHALRGKSMQVVVSAGASAQTYSHAGLIQSTAEEVLTPMKASALYVGMNYLPPLVFHDAMGPSDESLGAMQTALTACLNGSPAPANNKVETV